MRVFVFIVLLSIGALSARGQSTEWHSLMSAPDRFRHAWLSSDKSTIAVETINGYFVIFDATSGNVLRHTACVPRVATREVVSFPGKTAVSSITQDTALVLTCDVVGRSAKQYLDLIDVRSGVTLKRVDLRSQLPDTTRGYFCEMQWDQASGVVTLGLRKLVRNSSIIDAYYQLTLYVNEQLALITGIPTYTFGDDYDLWLHPFPIDRSSFPEQTEICCRDGKYLVSSAPNKTVVYQPPSTQEIWTANEIPLALIDSTLVTVDVGLQRTHHRKIKDGTLIRTHQFGEGTFNTNATSPRDIIHAQSPSQRYIKTSKGMIDVLSGTVYYGDFHFIVSVTNEGDVIEFGDPHGRPMKYALRRTGYRAQTPPQFIGTPVNLLESPKTGETMYSTSGQCYSNSGSAAGVLGKLSDNTVSVGLVLNDGVDVNDRYDDRLTLYSVPASAPDPSMIYGCQPGYPSWVSPPYRQILFDPASMIKIGELSSHSRPYVDPIRSLYYSVDRTAKRVWTYELSYQPDPNVICNDSFFIEAPYNTHIIKGTGQLVTGKYVYDGKSCVQDSMDLGSAIAVGMMRPLAVLSNNNDLILVDMSTWPVIERWRTTVSQRMSVTFADQDHSIRCLDSTGRLYNISVRDGAIESMALSSWPDSVLRIHWSADGSLITAEPRGDRMITTWDHRGTLLRQLSYPDPYDRRVIVTSESARIFITTNDFSQSSGFATWWSDGITPTPTTVQESRTDVDEDVLSYPLRVYSTLGQLITTIAAPADLVTLKHGLYIFVSAAQESSLQLIP